MILPDGCEMWAKVGSDAMGLPDPKDIDTLFLSENRAKTVLWFGAREWKDCMDESESYGPGKYDAFRKGIYNAIVLYSAAEFYGFLAAFFICKKYQIASKVERAAVHNAFRGNTFTPAEWAIDNRTREVLVLALKGK